MEELKIEEKLMHIQAELKAPKNQFNKFGNYKYRSCEDILEAVKPLLEKYRCTLIIEDSIEFIGGRFYVMAKATIYDTDHRGDSISSRAFAREEETKKGSDGSQITGASSSYARKYCLNGLFLIDDTKDADATNTNGKEEKKATPEQVARVRELVGDGIPAMLKYYNIEKAEDLLEEQAKDIIAKKEGK